MTQPAECPTCGAKDRREVICILKGEHTLCNYCRDPWHSAKVAPAKEPFMKASNASLTKKMRTEKPDRLEQAMVAPEPPTPARKIIGPPIELGTFEGSFRTVPAFIASGEPSPSPALATPREPLERLRLYAAQECSCGHDFTCQHCRAIDALKLLGV